MSVLVSKQAPDFTAAAVMADGINQGGLFTIGL